MFTALERRCIQPLLVLYRRNHTHFLKTSEENGTREITMIHEKTRNSLSLDMMNYLIEAINTNKDDKALRAIILASNGKIFSAGHNLKELQASSGVDHHKAVFEKATELMMTIVQSPVPVIAKVNGIAAAAGCQLAAQCDMTVCSDTSKFSTPGANFGIFCSTPGVAVGRLVPKSRAMFMLLTGEAISAQEAYDSGLVTKVVPADQLDAEVANIIDKIKHKSRKVISKGKQFYYKQMELGLSEAYKLGGDLMVQNVNLEDGQEGIRSFVEKRKAEWSHE